MHMQSKRTARSSVLRNETARVILAIALALVAVDVVPWRNILSKDAASPDANNRPNSAVQGMPVEWLLRQSFASKIIVSEKAKLIYCPVPKAASSNWKYLIRKFEGKDDYANLSRTHSRQHSGLKFLTEYSEERVEALLTDPTMFKFAFVRDPAVRAVSCYNNKFKDPWRRSEYRTFMAKLYNWTYANSMDMERDPHPTFKDFLVQLKKQDPEEMDDHWRPQTRLCGFGAMEYDFIGRMETVETDAAYVLRRLRKEGKEKFPTQRQIGFLPSGTRKDMRIAPELQKMIDEIYKEDYRHGLRAPQPQSN